VLFFFTYISFDIFESDLESPIGQVEELIRFVETRYVDSVNRTELVSEAIEAILKKLDPHSIYITPEQLQRVNQEMDGTFNGIGIESFYIDDTVNIIATLPDSPAERAGIMPFDKIISIKDSLVAGNDLDFSAIQDMIKGQLGDKLQMKLLDKAGVEKEITVTIGDIPLKSIDVALNISPEVGYVKINRFSSTTYKEFMDQFEDMHESGTKHMIIDLRGNPGGFLPEATNILSQLYRERGKLLVYTEGRNGNKLEYKTTGKPFFQIDKISVLIDEGSASGSEIIAGAIQEWDRGAVIGRRSFGKGLVQEQYDLGNGGAIRLTVARYYTPSGRSIQKTYNDMDQYDEDIYQRINGGELYHQDSVRSGDDTSFKTRILERELVGGGGITPDVFVPIDSVELDYDFIQINNKVSQFVYKALSKSDDNDIDLLELEYNFYESLSGEYKVTNAMKDDLRWSIKEAFVRYTQGEEAMYTERLSNDKAIMLSQKYFEGTYSLEEL